MALTVNRLGMSLVQMDKFSEKVRFLDDVDLTVSLDKRGSTSGGSAQQLTSIEVAMQSVVVRASYRDINLITSIVNNAVELYNRSQQPEDPAKQASASNKTASTARAVSKSTSSWPQTVGSAHVLVSKEQVCSSCVS